MNRDFKGIWIPKEIWLTKELTLIEKLFLIEIDSLDNDQHCFASNAYFSEFFDISKGRCTQIIKSLESKGFIQIELERQGKQITKRIIRVVNKLNTPIAKTKQGYLENDQENNTSPNKTINNTEGKLPKKVKRFQKPSLDALFEFKNSKQYLPDPHKFLNYYESNGWKVGRSPMKCWKSTFITWHLRDLENVKAKAKSNSIRGRSIQDALSDRSWANG
jgi:hypothetical protein